MSDAAIADLIERLRISHESGILRTLEARRTQLRQLQRLLVEGEDALLAALATDLGKPPMEAYSTEIGLVLAEIKTALRQLDVWCAPQRVKVQLAFKPGVAEIVPEPLGVVLVIAPWNYPVQLLLAPLVPALAAGNTVILK